MNPTLDGASQAVIMVCGYLAIHLSQDKRPGVRRWACIVGMCAQPAWYYTTFTHQQWGIFLVSFLYTYSWCRGIYNFWIKEHAA